MKTKKFFAKYILAIFTALCIVSNYACGDSDDEPQSSTTTEDSSSSTNSSTSTESTISVTFSSVDEVDIVAGETVSIEYTLSNATSGTTVTVTPDSNYKATVENQTTSGGTILVTAPDTYCDGYVTVTVTDEDGNTSLYVINFYERQMTITGEDLSDGVIYSVSPTGGTVEIPVSVNFEYEVVIPSEDQDWISSNVSSRSTMRDETITLTVSTNTTDYERSSIVSIMPSNGSSSYLDLSIMQSVPYFYVDETEFVADAMGDTLVINVTSNIGFSVNISSDDDWISKSIESDGDAYTVSLFVDENPGYERSTSLSLYSYYGDLINITVTQNSNEEACMVFYVSANSDNNYKVTLPIWYLNILDGSMYTYNINCTIDWGDGNIEEGNTHAIPSHTYSGISSETFFDIKVYGTVEHLNSTYLQSNASRKRTFYAIKQWGNTGLKDMSYAFDYVTSLESIPTDDTGSFKTVHSFAYCFRDTNIDTIPNGLFKYCTAVTTFYQVFCDCPITSIPDDLFLKCVYAENFSYAFKGTDITSIPDNLFSNCTRTLYFNETFRNCYSLTSFPVDLFSNCTKATRFMGTFSGCVDLTGESPYSIIDGEKVHLYERGNYPDEFSTITKYDDCFLGCSNLTDYDDIPDSWK